MKINIYYGGRGLIGDPTLVAVKIMMNVFEELNVKVEKFDLFEAKNSITTLPRSLKDADGVILASTVEWHGVGGMMMSFLDACWLYGDKEKISRLYMAHLGGFVAGLLFTGIYVLIKWKKSQSQKKDPAG